MGEGVVLVRTRMEEVDFYKAVCCILVIVIHVTAVFWYEFEPSSPQHISVLILNLLSRYAVQAFVFINAYVMYNGYHNRNINIKKYSIKRFKTIVIPYLIWSAVYMIYFSLIGKKTLSLAQIVFDLRLGKASYHLYFMVLIIQFYILFPILIKIYKWVNRPILFMTGVVILKLLLNPYITIDYKDRFFFSYISFYILGFVIADLKMRDFKLNLPFKFSLFSIHTAFVALYLIEGVRVLLGLPRLIATSYKYDSFLYVHSAMIVLYLIALFYKHQIQAQTFRKIVTGLGQLSFTIYFVHRLLMSIWHELPIYPIIKRASMSVAFILELTITVVLSIVIAWLLKNIQEIMSHKLQNSER